MVEEAGDIEQYFHQIRISKLPEDRKPKFQIGDLVRIVFRSDYGPNAYQLKDDLSLVCEILYYECNNYTWEDREDRDPFYIIEYKLIPSNRSKEFRYVSERNLRKVKDD
jgi:hypothetical protein